MKRIVFVLLCCSALFWGTANTFAGSITYKLQWSGADLGNSATAEGTITLDDTLVPNPGRASGQNPFGTTFSDLVMTVSGASSGNGTFSSAAG